MLAPSKNVAVRVKATASSKAAPKKISAMKPAPVKAAAKTVARKSVTAKIAATKSKSPVRASAGKAKKRR